MNFYDEVMPEYPTAGSRCITRHGKGKITKVDIFREEISILLDEAGEIKMSLGELKRARSRNKFTILDGPVSRDSERVSGLDELEG